MIDQREPRARVTRVTMVALLASILALVLATACGGRNDEHDVFNAFDDPGFTAATLEAAWRRYDTAWARGDVETVIALTSYDSCPRDRRPESLTALREQTRKAMVTEREIIGSTTLPAHPTVSLATGNSGSVEWTTGVDEDGNPTGRAEDWIFLQGEGWRLSACPL